MLVSPNRLISPSYSGGFSPLDFSDLVAWFDASNPDKVTLNGGDVSNLEAVNDASIGAAQTTAALQPLYALAAINGRNAVDFEATDGQRVVVASFPHSIGTGDLYISAVLKAESLGNSLVSFGNDTFQFHLGGGWPAFWDGTGNDFASLGNHPVGSPFIIEYWRFGASVRCRLDNVLDTDVLTSSVNASSNTKLTICGSGSWSGENFDGMLAELSITDSLPSQTMRDSNYSYLKSRWGL